MDANFVTIEGRLACDPEHRTTPSGVSLWTFAVCHNNRKKKGNNWEDEPHFFDCKYFGKQDLQGSIKGDRVTIVGRLTQERWEDKTGGKRSKVVVIANSITSPPVAEKTPSDGYGDDDPPF